MYTRHMLNFCKGENAKTPYSFIKLTKTDSGQTDPASSFRF